MSRCSWLAPAVAVVVTAASVVVGGCATAPHRTGTAGAAGPVTVAVSPARPFRVTVPGVATVTGARGAFRGRGTVTVRPVHVPLPFGASLAAASSPSLPATGAWRTR